ncbi:MAG: hypothetical protein IPF51_04285 [Dehalococcoidia bacterium]|uniref:hypothetical protein n=1 Tax=Candidatus Amarobacter glycogenicus TaxID=3140699 RepID=UPI002A0B825F|nr:hypothetical protein [Dehalococcoidia bacterium]MBK9612304.1 hypothetical protein [Dehalococcoidia bacterium]
MGEKETAAGVVSEDDDQADSPAARATTVKGSKSNTSERATTVKGSKSNTSD